MLKEWILENVIINGRISASWSSKNYSKLKKHSKVYTEILNYNNGRSIKEKLYMIVNNIDNIPVCSVCNKNHVIELTKFTKGFVSVCSLSCTNKLRALNMSNKLLDNYGVSNVFQLESVKQKIKQTNLERYGTQNVFQSEETKKKIKQTCLDRYGVPTPIQNKNIQDKIKQTCLDRYNVENVSQSKEIRKKVLNTLVHRYNVTNVSQLKDIQNKIQQTCLDRYGVNHFTQSKYIKDKIINTLKVNYGVSNVFQLESVKYKIKQTCLDRYNVEHYTKTPKYIDDVKRTCLDRYGVEHYSKSNEFKTKYAITFKLKYYNILCKQLNNKKIHMLSEKNEYINNSIFKFKCLICR